jgi:hypothetical protein
MSLTNIITRDDQNRGMCLLSWRGRGKKNYSGKALAEQQASRSNNLLHLAQQSLQQRQPSKISSQRQDQCRKRLACHSQFLSPSVT